MLVCLLFSPVNLSASQCFLSIFLSHIAAGSPNEVQQRQMSPKCSDYEKTSSFSVLFCWEIANLLPDHWAVLHDPPGPGQTSHVPTQALLSSRNATTHLGSSTRKPATVLWVLLSKGTQVRAVWWPILLNTKSTTPLTLIPRSQEMRSPSSLKRPSRALQGHHLRLGRNMNHKLFIPSQPYNESSEYINWCKALLQSLRRTGSPGQVLT